MNFSPVPNLTTERLLLRKITEDDAPQVLFLRSDTQVNKYIQRPEHRQVKTIADALQLISQFADFAQLNQSITWGICDRETNEFIGTICLWNFSADRKTAEIGYDLHPDFHGKGIMTEALQQVVTFGFNEAQFEMIEAFTHFENASSIKLLTSNYFARSQRTDSGNLNNVIFELWSEIWAKRY